MKAQGQLEHRWVHWQRHQTALEAEQARISFLQKPLPKVNSEAVTKPTRIKRIHPQRGFIANGKPVALGEIVRVPYACAKELVYLKKAEFVE